MSIPVTNFTLLSELNGQCDDQIAEYIHLIIVFINTKNYNSLHGIQQNI